MMFPISFHFGLIISISPHVNTPTLKMVTLSLSLPNVVRVVLIGALLCLASTSDSFAEPAKRLHVSDDGWHFVDHHDKPFFWLADTGWEIAHWLDREEIDHYLQVRSQQGFTVIQMMILVEHGLFEVPNRYGDFALFDKIGRASCRERV